jgi:hypothetical protein
MGRFEGGGLWQRVLTEVVLARIHQNFGSSRLMSSTILITALKSKVTDFPDLLG